MVYDIYSSLNKKNLYKLISKGAGYEEFKSSRRRFRKERVPEKPGNHSQEEIRQKKREKINPRATSTRHLLNKVSRRVFYF